MTIHRIATVSAVLLSVSAAEAAAPLASVTVINTLPEPREEMIEIDESQLPATPFVISDAFGTEIPWQLTHDGKIIFPAAVDASAEAVYTVSEGRPAEVDHVAYAAFYPERFDDIAWENDFGAYRAYGPAFGAAGNKGFGFDVFTKATERPVMPERYFNEIIKKVSYHTDHGDGMDVYDVGATLGGGAPAPLAKDGSLIFPGAFSEWKILDNGPLRATIELTFDYGGGRETRTVTLDAGTPYNRTVSRFTGFDADSVAAGVVVHRPAENDYVLGPDYVAFYDPTNSPGGRGTGRISVGVVVPGDGVVTRYKPLDEPAGKAVGHALAVTPYREGDGFEYYWGSSWNKGRIMTFDRWVNGARALSRRLRAPLEVTVSR